MLLRLDQIDVGELAEFVDQHDAPGAYVDPATGKHYTSFDDEVLGDDNEPVDLEEVDWIPIGGDGSSGPYADMDVFAAAVADPTIRGRLQQSLVGRGAFRRFRDAIWHAPEEVSRAWSSYRDGCAQRRVLDWIEDNELVDPTEVATARAELDGTLGSILAKVGKRRRPAAVVDIADKLSAFSEHWSPKVVARLNDYEVKLVKLAGEFVWHTHEDTDELFLVIDGSLTILLRDGDVSLGPGQIFVVPAGVEHCPVAEGEVSVLLIEPEGVVNTGDAGGELTAAYDASLAEPAPGSDR